MVEELVKPRVVADGIEFAVAVRPGSRVESVGGTRRGDLVVLVRAAPERGKANAAVEAAIADAFDRPRRDVSLISGHKGRQKRVRVIGVPAHLLDCWSKLVDQKD